MYHIPATVSDDAKELLAALPPVAEIPDTPGPEDTEGWAEFFAAYEAELEEPNRLAQAEFEHEICEIELAGVRTLDIRSSVAVEDSPIIVYLHGGAYTLQSPESCLALSVPLANETGLRVLSLDYPKAPRSRWRETMASVIDAIRQLLEEGHSLDNMIFFGDSAGGGLAAGTILKMRDDNIGMPAACVLLCPWTDITDTGDTYETLKGAETSYSYARHLKNCAAAYADPADQKNPYVSAVYGDFGRGFPPSLVQGGTKEIFLSNFVRFYQALDAAGRDVRLDLYEGMIHDFPLMNCLMEESVAWRRNTARFLRRAGFSQPIARNR